MLPMSLFWLPFIILYNSFEVLKVDKDKKDRGMASAAKRYELFHTELTFRNINTLKSLMKNGLKFSCNF